jgi:hypothetical protein
MKIPRNKEGASALAAVGYIFAISLILLGILVLFSLASPEFAQSPDKSVKIVIRLIMIFFCFGMGGGLIVFITRRVTKTPDKMEVIQKIDLSGDVQTEKLSCRNCGANLEQNSVKVKAGAVFINCPYCGSSYQITEEPKW